MYRFLANDDYIIDDTTKGQSGPGTLSPLSQQSGSFSISLRDSADDIDIAAPAEPGQTHGNTPMAGSLTMDLAKEIEMQQRKGTIDLNTKEHQAHSSGHKE